jgi:aquaglyceroporin related protein
MSVETTRSASTLNPSPHEYVRQDKLTSVFGQPTTGYHATHAEHGPPIDHIGPEFEVIESHPQLPWSRLRHRFREPLSEFFGTFILILFGDGVIAQVELSGGEKGTWLSINWGWGYGST